MCCAGTGSRTGSWRTGRCPLPSLRRAAPAALHIAWRCANRDASRPAGSPGAAPNLGMLVMSQRLSDEGRQPTRRQASNSAGSSGARPSSAARSSQGARGPSTDLRRGALAAIVLTSVSVNGASMAARRARASGLTGGCQGLLLLPLPLLPAVLTLSGAPRAAAAPLLTSLQAPGAPGAPGPGAARASKGGGAGEEQGRDVGTGPSVLPSSLPPSGAGGSCTAWAAAPDLEGCPPGAGGAVSFEKARASAYRGHSNRMWCALSMPPGPPRPAQWGHRRYAAQPPGVLWPPVHASAQLLHWLAQGPPPHLLYVGGGAIAVCCQAAAARLLEVVAQQRVAGCLRCHRCKYCAIASCCGQLTTVGAFVTGYWCW